ncbi:hypothetical protein GCM10028805_66000 [Spirosoma harenae]
MIAYYYCKGTGNPWKEYTIISAILGNSRLTSNSIIVAGEWNVKKCTSDEHYGFVKTITLWISVRMD